MCVCGVCACVWCVCVCGVNVCVVCVRVWCECVCVVCVRVWCECVCVCVCVCLCARAQSCNQVNCSQGHILTSSKQCFCLCQTNLTLCTSLPPRQQTPVRTFPKHCSTYSIRSCEPAGLISSSASVQHFV